MVAAQAQLEQTIAVQEARIAEAVAELRTRSVELSTIQTPLLRVRHDTIVAPLIGRWDTLRATQFVDQVLGAIEQHRSRTMILDLTGQTSMSDAVAAMVGEIVRAARLLGCATILVGIQPETTQALIALQDTVTELRTASDLAAGLRLVAQLRSEHVHAPV